MQWLHCMMQFILILLSAGTITDGDDTYGPRDKRYHSMSVTRKEHGNKILFLNLGEKNHTLVL